mmetsp:Transcript_16952/g.50123  ORF Transcript_16952/g.50123 Transcript_16952/m.50123 type:complete len:527 (-) Transcript_16952:84-1664(-)
MSNLTAHPHAVTPLSFVPVTRHPQQTLRRGRRMSLLPGWQMSGNLHTLGYFSAPVCLGSPSRQFDLIVDTGSALTALPCEGCPHCGSHKHGSVSGARFSEKASSTSEPVVCSRPPRGMSTCRSCDGGKCAYSVSYTEGSSIRGHLVYDSFWFGTELGNRAVRASFGCQTYESGLFYSQVADGITGMSQGQGYGPCLFDYLRDQTRAPNVFSICLSEEVGALVLGGTVPPDLKAEWVPYSGSSSYVVDLVDIRVSGASIGEPSSVYRSTIIDSGTTFMYLPPGPYRKVRDQWRNHCPWGACASRVAKGEYPDDYCYTMSTDELRRFAPHSLHFANGVRVNFDSRQYAYELRRGVWCLGVFDNEHNGAVIGAANMRNYEVIFDRDRHRVAFYPSDCGGMHALRHSSVLQGGYSLNGCSRKTPPRAGPPPPPSPPPPPPPPCALPSLYLPTGWLPSRPAGRATGCWRRSSPCLSPRRRREERCVRARWTVWLCLYGVPRRAVRVCRSRGHRLVCTAEVGRVGVRCRVHG